jgi:hypothetical protein
LCLHRHRLATMRAMDSISYHMIMQTCHICRMVHRCSS